MQFRWCAHAKACSFKNRMDIYPSVPLRNDMLFIHQRATPCFLPSINLHRRHAACGNGVICFATPAFLTASAESPPPMTVSRQIRLTCAQRERPLCIVLAFRSAHRSIHTIIWLRPGRVCKAPSVLGPTSSHAPARGNLISPTCEFRVTSNLSAMPRPRAVSTYQQLCQNGFRSLKRG